MGRRGLDDRRQVGVRTNVGRWGAASSLSYSLKTTLATFLEHTVSTCGMRPKA